LLLLSTSPSEFDDNVIYLCSLVETFLENACKKLEFIRDRQDARFALNRGGGKWGRCKEFLERQGVFIVPEMPWSALQSLWRVRNCIVHDNGDPAGLGKEEKAELCLVGGLRVDGYEVVIEHEFVCNCFAAFKDLVAGFNSELGNLIDSQLREASVGNE
jgi:hypothetical protein